MQMQQNDGVGQTVKNFWSKVSTAAKNVSRKMREGANKAKLSTEGAAHSAQKRFSQMPPTIGGKRRTGRKRRKHNKKRKTHRNHKKKSHRRR